MSRKNKKNLVCEALLLALKSRQVEELLMARHGVERRIAFRGRLEHLRRLGCPVGVNTGKGRPAEFRWPQIFELALALDLMELGITPEFTATAIKENREKIFLGIAHLFNDQTTVADIVEAASAGAGKWPIDFTTFVRVNVQALSGLMPDGRQIAPSFQLIHGDQVADWLRSAPEHQAANVLVDLGSRVVGLLSLLPLYSLVPVASLADALLRWTGEIRAALRVAMSEREGNDGGS